MRKVSMATRAELVAAISGRYVLGGRAEKARMLDEFVALTGFHRKHAMQQVVSSSSRAMSFVWEKMVWVLTHLARLLQEQPFG